MSVMTGEEMADEASTTSESKNDQLYSTSRPSESLPPPDKFTARGGGPALGKYDSEPEGTTLVGVGVAVSVGVFVGVEVCVFVGVGVYIT